MFPRIGIGVPSFINSAGGGTPPAPSLLLDTYSGAATAYSLRKLRTDYSGPAITLKVLDGGANPEHQIFFDGNGELDTTQIQQVCGSFEGVVAQWWDQSGNNRHASQTNIVSMPKIYQVVEGSGSVITTSGKPSINFDTTDQLVFSAGLTNYANLAAFFVNKQNSTADSISLALHDGLQAIYFNWTSSTADRTYYGGGFIYTGASGTANTNRKLMTLYSDSSNGYLQLNNSQIGTRSNGSTITGNQYINGYGGGDLKVNMNTQELIIYNTNQVSNISGINLNINSFYSIY